MTEIRGLSPHYLHYQKQKCFVAYSESADWAADLLDTCESVLSLSAFNLEIDYARKHLAPDSTLREKAVDLIANSQFGIYDISYWQDDHSNWRQPNNVFIELGIAISLNRPALLLRHVSNDKLELPEPLKSLEDEIVHWGGPTSLQNALKERLPQWPDASPEQDWWKRYCIFGGRLCEFREIHPRRSQWGQQRLQCHVSDGQDSDREDFRGVVESILGRYDEVRFDYLNTIPIAEGYQFLSCTHCQTVRSTPFSIYRITPHTPPEAYIAIGISIGLEQQFEYSVPKIFLVANATHAPSLLSGYEVVIARNHRQSRSQLRRFIPQVMNKVRESVWRPRPLPFLDADVEGLEESLDQITPEPGDLLKGIIVSISQQGVIIDLGIKRNGLVPPVDLQELSTEERGSLQVDDEITVSVLSTSDQESLLVSIYKARVLEDWEKAEALKESGEVFEVLIDGYNKGGLICPFGRLRGFIPLSHMSGFSRGIEERERQRRMAKMRGDSIAVQIIEADRQRQRLVMSQREGQKQWDAIRKREYLETLTVGEIVKGRVRSLQDFGAFVDLGPADGLIHISELAWYRVAHPRDVLRVGEEIEAQVLRVDPERMRVSLSRKPLLTNPWTLAEEKYQIGQLVEGRIVRITDYGAFVQLEPGIEGLLHVSQLSRTPVQDPREIVAEGETHLLRVVSIQSKRQRIGLSLKQVSYLEQIDWMEQQSLLNDD